MNKSGLASSRLVTENVFRSFQKIADFVQQLKDTFAVDGKFRELILYNHLLGKTKMSNKSATNKHITLFSDFCSHNNEALLSKDVSKLVQKKISYSDKVFIDIYSILTLKESTPEDVDAIWNHLLVIQATIDPTSEARALLSKLKESSSNEGQFLDNFLDKIEKSIDKDKIGQDPMTAASSILQSGVLNDLVGSIDNGVKSGNLDLGKLVGTVQSMLGGLTGGNMSSPPGGGAGGIDIGNIMGMVGNMMNGMNAGGNSGNGTEGGVDMGNIMGMMGSLMGGGGSNGLKGLNLDSVKEQIESRVNSEYEKEKKENDLD